MGKRYITFMMIPPNGQRVWRVSLRPHTFWLGLGALVITFTGLLINVVASPSERCDSLALAASESSALDPAVFDPQEPEEEPEQFNSDPWMSSEPPTPNGLLEEHFEPLKKLLGYLNESRAMLEFVPSIWPAGGSISSPFGMRADPVTGAKAMHYGVDIKANAGSPVVATATGKVIFAGRNGSLGHTVIIHHGNGFATRYGHLQNILVKRGDQVKKYQQVATVGSSGRSTGAHLHYEVHRDGVRADPAPFMGERVRVANEKGAQVAAPPKAGG